MDDPIYNRLTAKMLQDADDPDDINEVKASELPRNFGKIRHEVDQRTLAADIKST